MRHLAGTEWQTAMLQHIINGMGEGVLAIDAGCRVVLANRRFIELYAAIVLKVDPGVLGSADDLAGWRQAIAAAAGVPLPGDVVEQLHGAVRAVFESWNSRRARRYREHHGVPDHFGTAVVVQAMVFGNLDEQSGTLMVGDAVGAPLGAQAAANNARLETRNHKWKSRLINFPWASDWAQG